MIAAGSATVVPQTCARCDRAVSLSKLLDGKRVCRGSHTMELRVDPGDDPLQKGHRVIDVGALIAARAAVPVASGHWALFSAVGAGLWFVAAERTDEVSLAV